MNENDENRAALDVVGLPPTRKRRSESRRSSILKKSPARCTTEDTKTFSPSSGTVKKSRRISRRVSFAETFQVKEFIRDYNQLWQSPDKVAIAGENSHKDAVHISGLDKLLSGPIHNHAIIEPVLSKETDVDVDNVFIPSSNENPPQDVLQGCESISLPISPKVHPHSGATFEQLYDVPQQIPDQLYRGIYRVRDTVDFSTVVNTSINKISPVKRDREKSGVMTEMALMDLTNVDVDEHDGKRHRAQDATIRFTDDVMEETFCSGAGNISFDCTTNDGRTESPHSEEEAEVIFDVKQFLATLTVHKVASGGTSGAEDDSSKTVCSKDTHDADAMVNESEREAVYLYDTKDTGDDDVFDIRQFLSDLSKKHVNKFGKPSPTTLGTGREALRAAVIVEPVMSCDVLSEHERTQIFKDGCNMEETEVIPNIVLNEEYLGSVNRVVTGPMADTRSTPDGIASNREIRACKANIFVNSVVDNMYPAVLNYNACVKNQDEDRTQIYASDDVEQTQCLGQIIQTMPRLLENSHELSSSFVFAPSQSELEEPGSDAMSLFRENNERHTRDFEEGRTQVFTAGQQMELTECLSAGVVVATAAHELTRDRDEVLAPGAVNVGEEPRPVARPVSSVENVRSVRSEDGGKEVDLRDEVERVDGEGEIVEKHLDSCHITDDSNLTELSVNPHQLVYSVRPLQSDPHELVNYYNHHHDSRRRTVSGNDMEETECLPLYIATTYPMSDAALPRKKHIAVYDKENINHIYADASLLDETRFMSPGRDEVSIHYGASTKLAAPGAGQMQPLNEFKCSSVAGDYCESGQMSEKTIGQHDDEVNDEADEVFVDEVESSKQTVNLTKEEHAIHFGADASDMEMTNVVVGRGFNDEQVLKNTERGEHTIDFKLAGTNNMMEITKGITASDVMALTQPVPCEDMEFTKALTTNILVESLEKANDVDGSGTLHGCTGSLVNKGATCEEGGIADKVARGLYDTVFDVSVDNREENRDNVNCEAVNEDRQQSDSDERKGIHHKSMATAYDGIEQDSVVKTEGNTLLYDRNTGRGGDEAYDVIKDINTRASDETEAHGVMAVTDPVTFHDLKTTRYHDSVEYATATNKTLEDIRGVHGITDSSGVPRVSMNEASSEVSTALLTSAAIPAAAPTMAAASIPISIATVLTISAASVPTSAATLSSSALTLPPTMATSPTGCTSKAPTAQIGGKRQWERAAINASQLRGTLYGTSNKLMSKLKHMDILIARTRLNHASYSGDPWSSTSKNNASTLSSGQNVSPVPKKKPRSEAERSSAQTTTSAVTGSRDVTATGRAHNIYGKKELARPSVTYSDAQSEQISPLEYHGHTMSDFEISGITQLDPTISVPVNKAPVSLTGAYQKYVTHDATEKSNGTVLLDHRDPVTKNSTLIPPDVTLTQLKVTDNNPKATLSVDQLPNETYNATAPENTVTEYSNAPNQARTYKSMLDTVQRNDPVTDTEDSRLTKISQEESVSKSIESFGVLSKQIMVSLSSSTGNGSPVTENVEITDVVNSALERVDRMTENRGVAGVTMEITNEIQHLDLTVTNTTENETVAVRDTHYEPSSETPSLKHRLDGDSSSSTLTQQPPGGTMTRGVSETAHMLNESHPLLMDEDPPSFLNASIGIVDSLNKMHVTQEAELNAETEVDGGEVDPGLQQATPLIEGDVKELDQAQDDDFELKMNGGIELADDFWNNCSPTEKNVLDTIKVDIRNEPRSAQKVQEEEIFPEEEVTMPDVVLEMERRAETERFYRLNVALKEQCSEGGWLLDAVTIHTMSFLFLHNTIKLTVSLTADRNIDSLVLESALDTESSHEYSVLSERLFVASIKSTNLINRYPAETDVPHLLDHVSTVAATSLNLSRELEHLSYHHHIAISHNLVTMKVVDAERVRKVIVSLSMVPGCYHTRTMSFTIPYLFGDLTEDQVHSCVSAVAAGPQYFTRVVKALKSIV